MIHYFAYGSNLHPVRLSERVPSARFITAVRLDQYQLAFHKRSHDGSGKCNILHTGLAEDAVFGAIYTIDPAHKPALDEFEGKGDGYLDFPITLQHHNQTYACFTYVAQHTHIDDSLQPYHWYKQLVTLGARHLAFPAAYLSSIEAVVAMDDPDTARNHDRAALISRILNHI